MSNADESMMNEGFTDTSVDTTPADSGVTPAQTDQTADTSVDTTAVEQVLTAGQAKALREENARYRTQAQRYGQHFDGLDEDDQAALLEFVSAIQNDRPRAAQFAREYYEATTGQLQQQQAEAEQPLTRAEFQQLMSQRDQQVQQQAQEQWTRQQVAEINKQAEALGYKPGSTYGPDSWQQASDYETLLAIAVNVTGGDLKKADEIMKSRNQQQIGEFVAGRQQDARTNPLPVGSRGGPAASSPQNGNLQGWEAANAQIAAIQGRNK